MRKLSSILSTIFANLFMGMVKDSVLVQREWDIFLLRLREFLAASTSRFF